MHRLNGIGRGKGGAGKGQHGDVVGVVAHAVDVLLPDLQHLSQTAHHAALVGPPGRQLQQIGVGRHHLILGAPALAGDVLPQGRHPGLRLLKQ